MLSIAARSRFRVRRFPAASPADQKRPSTSPADSSAASSLRQRRILRGIYIPATPWRRPSTSPTTDSSVLADASEEQLPGPRPRWSLRPEQIRILQAIFDSGMVNPPREEIKKIRAHLQEFGQATDSNVFHWFQNRRSRSKQKNPQQNSATRSATSRRPLLAPLSSSSSSDRSSFNGIRSGGLLELSTNSSSGSVNQNYNIPIRQKNNLYMNLQLNQVQVQALPPYYQNQQPGAIATGVFGGGQTSGPSFNEIMGGGSAGGSSSKIIERFSRTTFGEKMIAGDSSVAVAGGEQRGLVFEDEVQHMLSYVSTNPITTTQTINVPPLASNFQIASTSQVQDAYDQPAF